MSYRVFRLLEREELGRVVSYVSAQEFVDGRITARGLAGAVKHNLQIPRTTAEPADADQILIAALQRNREFQRFAWPHRTTWPMFSRYDPGMNYGSHVDDGLMKDRGGAPLRSDYALTIFLCPADSYDGGELVVESAAGEQEIKLEAGEAVVYAATSVHHVNPVTRGMRLAAILWAQSMVRSPEVRAILSDLDQAVTMAKSSGDHDLAVLVNKSFNNFLRYACEP